MTTAIDRIGGPRGIALPRVAALCTALMLVVVVASAFLRHHADQAAWASQFALARQVHRVAATLVLLGAVALVWLARRERDGAALRRAVALLGVALLLSAVGVAAGASRAPPVVLVNLLGGFMMLALAARLTVAERATAGRAAAWLLALMALQAAGGAWASATAPEACASWLGCDLIATLHRGVGAVLAVSLVMVGARAGWRRAQASGAALALIGALLLMLGALAALLGTRSLPLLAVVHGAFAAAAVALLARRVA